MLLKAGADVNWKYEYEYRREKMTVMYGMENLGSWQFRYKVLKMISDAGFNFSANQGIVKKTL